MNSNYIKVVDYFLINFWGIGPNRRYAAVKYTLVMMAGGMPLLLGFILLAFNHAMAAHSRGAFHVAFVADPNLVVVETEFL